MLLFLLPIPLLLLSLALLAIGLRGRRIDDHPTCLACRFDLTGLALSGATLCPECGASLASPDAVRIGNRARRGRFITASLVILALTLAGAAGLGWSLRKGFNWNTVKPAWMLSREAHSPDPVTARAALTELLARLDKGTLGESRRRALMEQALAQQADPALPWFTQWGDLIEHSHAAGTLPDADWSRYTSAVVDIAVSARATVRRGDDLAVHAGPMLRSGSKAGFACRAVLTDIRLGDHAVQGPPGTFVLDALRGTFGGTASGPAWEHPLIINDVGMPAATWSDHDRPRQLAADVDPGTYTLETTWVIITCAPSSPTAAGGVSGRSTWTTYSWGASSPLAGLLGLSGSKPAPREPDLADRLLRGEEFSLSGGNRQNYMASGAAHQVRKVTRTATVKVVAADVETIDLVTDESLRSAMEKAITVTIGKPQYNTSDSRLHGIISFTKPPVDGAFEVIQRTPKGDKRLGCVVGKQDSQGVVAEFPLRTSARNAEGGYDIILKVSPDTARKTREVTHIWGHDLIFSGLFEALPHKPPMPTEGDEVPDEPAEASPAPQSELQG